MKKKCYIPVLRGRTAEYSALRDLTATQKEGIIPLTELFLSDSSEEKETDLSLNLGEDTCPGLVKIKTRARQLFECWGKRDVFVDGLHLHYWSQPDKIKTLLSGFYHEAHRYGLKCIPVTTIREELSGSFHYCVNEAIEKFRNGLAFRVVLQDGKQYREFLQLDNFVRKFGLRTQDVDVIVDLQDLGKGEVYPEALKYYVMRADRFRRVILLSGAFVKDLSDYDQGEVVKLARADLRLWKRICGEAWAKIPPFFGDYTIQHGVYKPLRFKPRPSASIRYASKDEWIILRGRKLDLKSRALGLNQYVAQTQILSRMPEFSGEDFSEADRVIANVAAGIQMPGRHPFWLRVGIGRHMALTSTQVGSLNN